MPYTCLVPGCNARSDVYPSRGFFRFPKALNIPNKPNRNLLSIERRFKWISALKREDLTASMLFNQRICGKHFVKGKPSKFLDTKNPDWVPTLFLDGVDNNEFDADYVPRSVKAERKIKSEDMASQCRTCLSLMTSHRNLARPDSMKLIEILEKLMECSLQLNDKEVFNICKKCEAKLVKIVEFREMCLYSRKKYLNEVNSKTSDKKTSSTIKKASPSNSSQSENLKRKSAALEDPLSIPQPLKQPRLLKDPLSDDTLSSDETLLNTTDPHLLRSDDPWVVNEANVSPKQSEEVILTPLQENDPLALTDDCLALDNEAKDPLLLDETSLPSIKILGEQIQSQLASNAPIAKAGLKIKTPDQLNSRCFVKAKIKKSNFSRLVKMKTSKDSPVAKPVFYKSDPQARGVFKPDSYKKPKIIMVKKFHLNANGSIRSITTAAVNKTKSRPLKARLKTASNISLEPYSQNRLSQYILQNNSNLPAMSFDSFETRHPPSLKKRLQRVFNDHTYALNWKHMKIGTYIHLKQFPINDVLYAIEECKVAMNNQTLYCPVCQYPATSDCSTVMSSHMRRQHGETYLNWCYLCNTIVADMGYHRKLRSCSTLYNCKFCPKNFKKCITLIRHLEFHNKKQFHKDLYRPISEDEYRTLPPNKSIEKIQAPLATLANIPNNSTTDQPLTKNNSKSADSFECVLLRETLLAPQKIKQEQTDFELQKELHEEIHIKEEPRTDEVVDIAETDKIVKVGEEEQDLLLAKSKTKILRVCVPKGVTDIVVTDIIQKKRTTPEKANN